MIRKQNHTHKFRRHIYNTGNKVFFCTLPDCNFKIDCALAIGKRSICNRCNDEFLIDELSVRLAKPHCKKCSKKKVKIDGATKYINPSAITRELAEETTDELKNRLSSIVNTAEEVIEDI